MKRKNIYLSVAFLCCSWMLFGQHSNVDTIAPPAIEGTCFARSKTPDKYKTIEEQVLVQAARTEEKFIPAEYDTIRQQVLVRQSYHKMITHEAEFDTVILEVNVKDKSRVIQEQYKTIFEVEKIDKKKDGEEDGQWVKVKIPNCNSPNPKDCETLRWVANKPEYNITTKEVFVQAEWADTVENGEIVRIPKVVQTKPARIEKIFVPAEYQTIEKVVLKRHARKMLLEVPPKYKTVKSKKLVEKGGKPVWLEIMCPKSLNEIVVSQVQLALKGRKYYKGSINGQLDKGTQAALEAFQKDNDLHIGKLDKYTIEALGFNYTIFKQPMEEDSE